MLPYSAKPSSQPIVHRWSLLTEPLVLPFGIGCLSDFGEKILGTSRVRDINSTGLEEIPQRELSIKLALNEFVPIVEKRLDRSPQGYELILLLGTEAKDRRYSWEPNQGYQLKAGECRTLPLVFFFAFRGKPYEKCWGVQYSMTIYLRSNAYILHLNGRILGLGLKSSIHFNRLVVCQFSICG